MNKALAIAAAVTLSTILGGSAHAALFEDFDGLNVGAINGQNGWTGEAWSYVGRDFTRGGDQFLGLRGANQDVYKALGGMAVADGSTSTLFFRFMPTTPDMNHGIGLSDVAAPAAWGDYEATALVIRDGRNAKLQGRNGAAYQDLGLNGGAHALTPGTWYDVWMVVNNGSGTTSDKIDYYIQGGSIAEQRLVGSNLDFRNKTSAALSTFLARCNSAEDFVLIDDIHISSGTELARPVAAPAMPSLNVPALYEFAGQKLAASAASLPVDRYPQLAAVATGAWDQQQASSWTSGFFPGMLWQLHERTGEQAWRDLAEARTAGIESQKTNDGTHDLGFMVFNSFGKGHLQTGRADYKEVVLTASDTLATRYSPTVGAIQSWGNKTTGKYEVIIDNMMNLEMLFWAAKNGGSAGFYDIAVNHALKTREEHVRPDGGSYHVVEYDRATGDVILKRTHQGLNNDSTWSRGQAWGIYGFTLTYRETQDERFLETAQLMADYFLDHLPALNVPFYDFDDTATASYDSSAAAVTASALLELMWYVGEEDRQRYFLAAEDMLLALAGPAFLTDGSAAASILRYGAVSRTGATEVGLIYGDYYFLEALSRYEAVPEPAVMSLLMISALAGLRRRRAS